jgi:hypothetical protein
VNSYLHSQLFNLKKGNLRKYARFNFLEELPEHTSIYFYSNVVIPISGILFGSGAYSVGTRDSFPWGKAAGV